ncbi:Cytokinesis protein sepH [Leucoagaricus sp. SymC.cos]|nr:Cytokinesis protein sepH [Leucoagaricus sp. SymC.cos]
MPLPRRHHTAPSRANGDTMSSRDSHTHGFFPNASGFKFDNRTFIMFESGETVIETLMGMGEPDAQHDSSARSYPPRCHVDTRTSLRSRILEWRGNYKRRSHLLWIMGQAATGKSAVAQTMAEEFAKMGCLGASFFFSRPNRRDDPNTLIPTLAYQLAINLPEYKRAITERLGSDPTILRKHRCAQFRELISEPLRDLMVQNHPIVSSPLVIIIDGLDECSGKRAQLEFIELFSKAGHLPLLWLVTSRPEYHLVSVRSHPDSYATCVHEDISIDDKEAQRDVQRLLRSGFKNIRQQYEDQLDPDWPSQEHVRLISAVALGHLGFTDFLLRFIGDKEYANPRGQLEVCLCFIGGNGLGPGAMNPLHALDLLYHQILSHIPGDYFKTTIDILALIILYPNDDLCAQDIANFLSLDQGAFYRSLQQMHPILSIPEPSKAHEARLQVYHPSFSDFLKDPTRSGKYVIDESIAHRTIAIQSLQWQIAGRESELPPQTGARRCTQSPQLKWVTGSRSPRGMKETLRLFASRIGWVACRRVPRDLAPPLISKLNIFPFCLLREEEVEEFPEFLEWLHMNGGKQLVAMSPMAALNLNTHNKTLHFTVFDFECIPNVGKNRDTQALVVLDRFEVLLSALRHTTDPPFSQLKTLKEHLSISEERNRVLAVLSRITSSTLIFPQCYELRGVKHSPRKYLAEGGCGTVYQGLDPTICIKVMKRFDASTLMPWVKEVILWAHSSHPNVLPFLGVFLEGQTDPPQTCLVSPFMKNGNLKYYAARLPQKSRLPLISDVVNGLHYLHDLGIVHGDLKGENVLISDEGRGLITDFGASHINTATAATGFLSLTTLRFSAPETVSGNKTPTKKCDIWSLSCLLYEALSRKPPYYQYKMDVQILFALARKETPSRPGFSDDDDIEEDEDDWDDDIKHDYDAIDDQAWGLIIKCCSVEPEKRPNITQVRELVVDLKIHDDRPASKTVPGAEISKLRVDPKLNLTCVEELLGQLLGEFPLPSESSESEDKD